MSLALLERAADDRRAAATRFEVAASRVTNALRQWSHTQRLARAVLVVDDHRGVGAYLAQVLAPLGLPVDVVQSFDTGVAAWRRGRHAVVVIDHHLDDRGGRTGTVLAETLGRTPSVVLVSSVAGLDDLRGAAAQLHAQAVMKPVAGSTYASRHEEDLRSAVRIALAEAEQAQGDRMG